MKNFFISYTSADRSWADWIAWTLQEAGYSTVHQAWDFRPGANFVSEMKKALQECERTIALYSPNYFNSGFGEDEWTAAFADRSLVPVRVRKCEIPKLLKPIVYIDLLNLSDEAAIAALLAGVKSERARPRERPSFPQDAPQARRFPGLLPEIFDVPLPRNQNFTGRDQMLRDLHSAVLTPISGLGGVGKTQLALEYTYRYASEYERVFWVRAEEPTTLASEYARIAARLKLPEKDLANQPEIISAVRDWLAHNAGWLLVFDNATGPDACMDYLPRPNTGRILITSRFQAWRGVADPVPVQKLAREESIAFLKKRTGRDETDAADELAEALGDLPLALEHAAAYVDSSGVSIAEYLIRLRAYPRKLLAPVEATFRISFEKLRSEAPRALDLLNLIAWFAPDNIPRDLLLSTASDQLEFDGAVAALRRYSLLQTGDGVISVHRLVQEVMQNRVDEGERRLWVEIALKLVDDAFPDPLHFQNWPVCAKLLAHALQVTEHGERLSVYLEAVSRLLNQAGLYQKRRGQFGSAEQLLRRALDIGEKVFGPDHLEVAGIASNFGLILQAQGDLAGALRYAQRALEIGEEVHDPDHPDVAIWANNLGEILKQKGDLVGALQYARRALEIGEGVYGLDDPNVAVYANNVGMILQEQGDLAGALQYTRRALGIDEKVYGPDDPNIAIDANNIGVILQAQGDLKGALEYTRRALKIDEKIYGPDHPDVARDANNVGTILIGQGDLSSARQYMRRALEIFQNTYGSEHTRTKMAAENLRLIEGLLPPEELQGEHKTDDHPGS